MTFQRTIGPVIGRVRNPTIVVGKIVRTPMAAPTQIPVVTVLAYAFYWATNVESEGEVYAVVLALSVKIAMIKIDN